MTTLQAAPSVVPRKQTEPVPEWGGDVIVRGLMASEAFAVLALRQQALRRVRSKLPADPAQPPEGDQAAPAEAAPAPDLEFEELRTYGLHISHLLARAVVNAQGLALCTVEEWEIWTQHQPAMCRRLQAVAERLSGLSEEAVEKNSPQSPS
jgi:hypothetical protein